MSHLDFVLVSYFRLPWEENKAYNFTYFSQYKIIKTEVLNNFISGITEGISQKSYVALFPLSFLKKWSSKLNNRNTLKVKSQEAVLI